MTGDTGGGRLGGPLSVMLQAMMGSLEAMEELRRQSRENLEEMLIGPARSWRAGRATSKPFSFGPAAWGYLRGVMNSPTLAQGLITALTERVLELDADKARPPAASGQATPGREAELLRQVAALEGEVASLRSTAEPTALDWAALRAERDRLAERLAHRERRVTQVEHDRDVEARNALRLVEELRDRDQKIMALDAELTEAQGRNATLEEKLTAAGPSTEKERW